MSKQKSYVITDAADQMAAELAEANGLSKSAIIEVLIRQAHATSWSVAGPVVASVPAAPIMLSSLPLSTRTKNALSNAIKPSPASAYDWIDANLRTLQDVASLGAKALKKQRNLGPAGLLEIYALCEQHGIDIL